MGERTLVDGYANGWLVTPKGPGTLAVDLRWQPQRLVWAGLAVSGITLVAIALLLLRSRRETAGLESPPTLEWASDRPGLMRAGLVAATVGVGTYAVATRNVAALAGLLTLAAGVVPRGRLLLVAAAPAALIVSRSDGRPALAWLAVAALAADLLLEATSSAQPDP